jgi:NADH-quinone oxidoreductase subunit E
VRVLDGVRSDVDQIVSKYPNARSAVLPLLFLAQSVEGHVTEDGMRDVAEALNLTPAEVLAVASFYTMLKQTPQGTYLISVCRNISCTHRGARKVIKALEDRLGIAAGETTPDGRFSLEAAECLATCDGAPSLQINYEDFYSVSPEQAVQIVDKLAADEMVLSVWGERVRTSKEMARETALAGARHGVRSSDARVVGGESPAPDMTPGTRPPVTGTEPGRG